MKIANSLSTNDGASTATTQQRIDFFAKQNKGVAQWQKSSAT